MIDQFWVLIAAVLVFIMQAGFLAFEIGCVRLKNVTATALKNVTDWVLLSLMFTAVGFGVMFGYTENNLNWHRFVFCKRYLVAEFSSPWDRVHDLPNGVCRSGRPPSCPGPWQSAQDL